MARICLCFVMLMSLFLLSHAEDADFPEISPNPPAPKRGFVSSKPAKTWEQGLISGNGTIGANVLSHPLKETVIFTHERLFMPRGKPVMPPRTTGTRLFEIRRLIERGLYQQATQLAFDLSGQEGFMYPDPFVPAFDLSIGMETGEKIADYRRSVDFQTGEATVRWAGEDGQAFERRLFVSRADGVAVLLISGSEQASVDCRLELHPRQLSGDLDDKTTKRSNHVFNENIRDVVMEADSSTLTYRNGFKHAYPGSIQALEAAARVVIKGGTVTSRERELVVSGADHVLVFVGINPVYDLEQSGMEILKSDLAALPAGYNKLLERHARIHGQLFNRMRLDLGGGSDDHGLTTEALLSEADGGRISKALIEKEFDAGRYNIISCVGELPPTLQGVWGGTYVPGWASDFTHNGNVPSAIASLLNGNTPELMLAYTSYIESIVPYLEINAKHMFGCRGVVLPSRSTTNGFNNALAPRFAGGFWVGGAAWAAHFFYDYYLYTGDRAFLSEHALPFMEKAALFFEDYLYEGDDGKFVFSPTQSPENTPRNTKSQGSFNATMSVAAAKELLRNTIAASQVLSVNQRKIPLWRGMLEKMPEFMIDDEGTIKEWLTPELENQNNHRHSSQLYPVYYGMPEEIAVDPALREAFRKVVEIKLDEHYSPERSGFMSFGVVQLGQAAASLGEGELAYRCVEQLATRYWLHNLASMHNHKSLFNMDISGGMPAVIIGMLAESEPGKVHLLPALPKAWPSGTIEGVLCRGQVEIKKLDWNSERILVSLVSAREQSLGVDVPFEIGNISVVGGEAEIRSTGQKNGRSVTLPANRETILEITPSG